jgi:hypothetical protein
MSASLNFYMQRKVTGSYMSRDDITSFVGGQHQYLPSFLTLLHEVSLAIRVYSKK